MGARITRSGRAREGFGLFLSRGPRNMESVQRKECDRREFPSYPVSSDRDVSHCSKDNSRAGGKSCAEVLPLRRSLFANDSLGNRAGSAFSISTSLKI